MTDYYDYACRVPLTIELPKCGRVIVGMGWDVSASGLESPECPRMPR